MPNFDERAYPLDIVDEMGFMRGYPQPPLIEYFGPTGRIRSLSVDQFRGAPNWVEQGENNDRLMLALCHDFPPCKPFSVDFAALERRVATWMKTDTWLMYSLVCGPEPLADWITPGPLPQELIDKRPQPVSAVWEMTHASYYGDPRQAEPWRGDARAARHPVDALPNRGPRRQRW
jgi:hypothetical protein